MPKLASPSFFTPFLSIFDDKKGLTIKHHEGLTHYAI